MLKLYMQVVGLIVSFIVTFFVCPRLISIDSDIAVILGFLLFIAAIPFIIWQIIKIVKEIIIQVRRKLGA